MLSLRPFGQVVPTPDRPSLLIEAADAIEAQVRREGGDVIELGKVFHEVANPCARLLDVGHTVRPEGPDFTASRCSGRPVPMRHGDALWKPRYQVVMHRTPLLKLCNPQVSAWNTFSCAVPPVLLGGRANVVCSPVIDANIGQGDHPSHRRTPPVVCKTVEVPSCPNRAPEPFYAFFLGLCLIEEDLEGTCFRWDKPQANRCAAGLRPCLRCACMRVRCPALLYVWAVVINIDAHAAVRMGFGFGKIPSCVLSS